VLGTNDVGIHDSRGGIERIDSRIDGQFGDSTRQHRRRVKMGECGRGSRIGKIVGRHIDGLHGGNRALLGGRNSLLHLSHVRRQRRLITHGGGDATEQRRHLGTGLNKERLTGVQKQGYLGESEDVVDKEEHILSLLITEVLGHGEPSETDSSASTRGLVHLAVHEGHLRMEKSFD
jgi:hypothetical protein